MRSGTCRIAAVLLLFIAAMMAGTARAETSVRPVCHAHSDQDLPTLQNAADLSRIDWICRNGDYRASEDNAWLMFSGDDIQEAGGASHFVTQISRFDRIEITAFGRGGAVTHARYGPDDVEGYAAGPNMALAMPIIEDMTAVVVRISKPWGTAIAAEGVLQQATTGAPLGWTTQMTTMLAILMGLLIAPLVYNYAFFLVLRERFILWHIAMVLGMTFFLGTTSGIYLRFVDVSLPVAAFINQVAFLFPTAAGAAFCTHFIEPFAMSKRMRDWTLGAGLFTLFVGIYASLPFDWMRPFGTTVYYLSYVPLIAIFVAGMYCAARRRSRAVWFQIYGWTPILLVGIERIIRGLGLYAAPVWLDQAIYLTLAFEIVLTALGVVDRFDVLRADRDKAEARIDALSTLVDRDALTGLFNRRALETRYPDLRADGFSALAIIDIDHFKRINDQFGHAMGDRVLQEVAATLSSDADIIGYRIGGEEFLMLMRGTDLQRRAEQMRRAISIRVANEIEGIDTPVTASMGLVDTTPGVATTLRRVYAHADRLLYEAKNSGRNRMLSERIQLFDAPIRRKGEDRRTGERRAAGAAH